MALIRLTHALKGLPVIDLREGRKIATFEDVMIDPETLKSAALITSKGNLLKRELKWIPGKNVKVWGKDAILVEGLDLIEDSDEFSGPKTWMSVWDEVRGRTVISMEGTRIAQIADMFMDETGKFVAYDLAQVFIQGPLAETRRLDIETTHSLGHDVLIVQLPEDGSVRSQEMPDQKDQEESTPEEMQHA
jgi:uncharacterized protein YrrD